MQLHKEIMSATEGALLTLLAAQPAAVPAPTQANAEGSPDLARPCTTWAGCLMSGRRGSDIYLEKVSLVPATPDSFPEILQFSEVMRTLFCFEGHSE